jgi:hypothetical protein
VRVEELRWEGKGHEFSVSVGDEMGGRFGDERGILLISHTKLVTPLLHVLLHCHGGWLGRRWESGRV